MIPLALAVSMFQAAAQAAKAAPDIVEAYRKAGAPETELAELQASVEAFQAANDAAFPRVDAKLSAAAQG